MVKTLIFYLASEPRGQSIPIWFRKNITNIVVTLNLAIICNNLSLSSKFKFDRTVLSKVSI